MRSLNTIVTLVAVSATSLLAGETSLESRITSVGLFKNGLAAVRRTLTIPANGVYLVADVPVPVHGTLWIESDGVVEAKVTTREVEEKVRSDTAPNLQEDLLGTNVTIYFRDGTIPPATGTVIKIDRAEAWDRRYERENHYGWWSSRNRSSRSLPQSRFLILQTSTGRIYVESSMIAYLHAEGAGGTVRHRKPVLLLTAQGVKKRAQTVTITYLTKGIAWAPSYRIDISNPKTLRLAQKAIIKNELEDITDAEIYLISGFPSVQFGHVISPLSLRTTWTNFFTQLNQRFTPVHASTSNVISQRAVMLNRPGPSAPEMGAIPTGEGVDLHYQPVGKRTMSEGDSLLLNVARAEAQYERIVEWIIPDTRKADGNFISDYERRQDPDKYQDAAWDAVRFKNPLAFPMTTGPAMVVSEGRFNGQRLSYWVNAGEETTVHVTKALSLRTRAREHEEKGKREVVYIGGNDFRKALVIGEVAVSNHREEAVSLVIRRRFSGDLLEAEGSPTCVLREEGVYSVNKRNELMWALTLKPGEQRALTYRYAVLVDN